MAVGRGRDVDDAVPVARQEISCIRGAGRRLDRCGFLGAHPDAPIDGFGKRLA